MVTTLKKIEIEPDLFNKICEIAKDNNTTENKILNDFIKKGIEDTEKSKVKTIVQNNPKLKLMEKKTFKKNNTRNFDELIGIIKAPPGFDPVEAVREIRRG